MATTGVCQLRNVTKLRSVPTERPNFEDYVIENMIEYYQKDHIAPQENKISLSLGRIFLELSAHFKVSETAPY